MLSKEPVLSRLEKATLLKNAVAKYYIKKNYAVNFEVGLDKYGRFRADVIAVNMGSQIIIVEVKSCKEDLIRDSKFLNYLKFCNKMYFVFDVKTYEKVKDLVPKGVGIFVMSPLGLVKVKKSASTREITPKIQLSVLTRMCYRSADRNSHYHKSKVPNV